MAGALREGGSEVPSDTPERGPESSSAAAAEVDATEFTATVCSPQAYSKVAVGRLCLAILVPGAARVPWDRGRPALERGQDALDPGTPRPQLPASADF